jgi:hypothetical protein
MPGKPRNPSYRLHKASGQVIVTLGGRDIYLGPYGSRASRDSYDRLLAEWLQNGRRPIFNSAWTGEPAWLLRNADF